MTESAQAARNAPNEAEVRAHLARVLESPPFARSRRLKRFLRYVVEAKLRGDEDSIQEYAIGLAVFDRRASFDPRTDSIVRSEARRLRQRLDAFYADQGAAESLRIELPPPGYVPRIIPAAVLTPPSKRWWGVAAGAAAAALIAAAAIGTTGRHEPDPRARAAYEKGMAAWSQWTRESSLQAERFFEEAISIEPRYAEAYVGLGRSYRQQLVISDRRAEVNLAKAINAVNRAIELDPELAVAHQTQGANLTYKPDWAAAEQSFLRAIELEPDNALLHHTYAITFLSAVGRLEEAEKEIQRAVVLDPGGLLHYSIHGTILYFQRRYPEAREVLKETLAIDPHYSSAIRNLALVALQQGETEEAVRLHRRAQELSYMSLGDGCLAYALAVHGDRAEALELVRRLEAEAERGPTSALGIAAAYVALGDHDRALEWLDRAWRNREMQVRYAPVDPMFDPLRADDRFQALLKRMGLERVTD